MSRKHGLQLCSMAFKLCLILRSLYDETEEGWDTCNNASKLLGDIAFDLEQREDW